MGCGSSQAPPYEICQLESDLFRELKLSKQEVHRLLKLFTDIDLDGSGMMRMDELFATCRIEETNCNKKIFGMFDSDDSGTLNFSEFGESFLSSSHCSPLIPPLLPHPSSTSLRDVDVSRAD